MITYYTYDAQGVFVGAVERTKYEALPKPCTTTAPPSLTGTEVARWDGSAWEVLAERPPLPLPDPAAWRETADLEKGAFCIALKRAGVLPIDEAVAAAKGEWPATFSTALASLPTGFDEAEAKIIWAATTRVRRTHPILLALIPMSSLTEADVDAMFGWTA